MRDWLSWVAQLGGAKKHEALLVADCATQWSDSLSILDLAQAIFGRVELTATERHINGWPAGSNSLFRHAAKEMDRKGQPFLWIEPDAIPLKPGWLDAIEDAYNVCVKPFLRQLYKPTADTIPADMMSGIGVYPADTIRRVEHLLNNKAWDVCIAEFITPLSSDTNLFQSHWGTPRSSPTFVARADRTPANAFTLQALHPEAVLFHRNKDGTLMRLLRHKLFPASADPFTVVLPFYRNDAALALKVLQWIKRIGTPPTHPILLSFESGTTPSLVGSVVRAASQTFSKVYQSHYPRPPRGTIAPTWAFIHAARTMQQMGRPWLWFEPDTVPLKSNWLEVLQEEYDLCGQPFCGPIVPHRGHMNGTGIYPANTPELIPHTMSHPDRVWDWEMKQEMIDSCHDCSRIFFHCWGEIGGVLNPIEGNPADFRNPELVKQIPESAVIMHRAKEGILIDVLASRL